MMRLHFALTEIGSEASEITYELLRHHLAKNAQQHEAGSRRQGLVRLYGQA